MGISIGQMAAKAKLNASTLRYYESIGLLPPSERKNGQRQYEEGIMSRLDFIKAAKKTGFRIQEIGVLLEGFDADDSPSKRWEQMAEQKRAELQEQKKKIDFMIKILDNGLQCKCLSWSECMEKIETARTNN